MAAQRNTSTETIRWDEIPPDVRKTLTYKGQIKYLASVQGTTYRYTNTMPERLVFDPLTEQAARERTDAHRFALMEQMKYDDKYSATD